LALAEAEKAISRAEKALERSKDKENTDLKPKLKSWWNFWSK
jgi:hypothetical protein